MKVKQGNSNLLMNINVSKRDTCMDLKTKRTLLNKDVITKEKKLLTDYKHIYIYI